MSWLYRWLRIYFGFSKTESNGFVVLIPVIFLTIISPYIYRNHLSGNNIMLDVTTMDSLTAVLDASLKMKQKENSYNYDNQKRYQAKSSTGYKDFKKKKVEEKVVKKYNKKKFEPFDINTADTIALKKVYGIGSVLSQRIIKYRDLLGGFTTKNQFNEVYGLEKEVIQRLDSMTFIDEVFTPKQLSINELKSYQLDDHPYLDKKIARAIDAYRRQHGKFDSIESLYSLHLVDSADVNKIAPYLKL